MPWIPMDFDPVEIQVRQWIGWKCIQEKETHTFHHVSWENHVFL
jgi:hypothetical protein